MPDPITRLNRALEGRYRIERQLGEGGMATVYLARDEKHSRSVALKVLKPELAAVVGAERFLAEIKTTANLQHPHILPLFDSGKADSFLFYVMPYVEGETLRGRLDREHQLPVEEAVRIATNVAEALDYAHRHGVIHRDIKPANILLQDGKPVLSDFGIALAVGAAGGGGLTETGLSLGTPHYMSPEQATGDLNVGAATDIYALGCVLYEMLVGEPPYTGSNAQAILGKIIAGKPASATEHRASVPASVDAVIGKSLERVPADRFSGAQDFAKALGDPGFRHGEIAGAPVAPAVGPWDRRLAWMAFAVASLVAAALAIPAVRHLRETPPPETRTEIVTPSTDQPAGFALSPDGRQIVFVASGDGASRLWVRSLGAPTAQPLAGTEGAVGPFWSPDGQSVGFFAGGALKRLDLGRGAPQTLAPATGGGAGGTWNAEGVIVFAPSTVTPLGRVSATGGTVTAVTTLDPQQFGHFAPFFLPDGRRFLFVAGGGPDVQGIYLSALDGSAPTRLTPDVSQAVYLPAGPGNASGGDGWLLWVRASTLVARRLDLDRQTLVGDPVTLADRMGPSGWSVAAPGLVAYRTGAGRQRQLTWVDRSGTARGTVGDPDGSLLRPRVSPDGRRVVVDRTVQDNADLWLLDGARTSRLTFDPAMDAWPVWSPDGTRIVFSSARTGAVDLYQTLTNGAGGAERLVASDQPLVSHGWSPDGRFLMYSRLDRQTNSDLWVGPMAGDHTPSVWLKTPFSEVYGAFSPDGRWVAYQSNESGRNEIYVRPFVPPGAAGTPRAAAGGQWQVSTTGGIHPVWRPDGKALYYLNPAGAIVEAPITVVGDRLEPGVLVVLFPARILYGGVNTEQGRQYDVAPDGRFLINMELDAADAAPITLIQQWNPEAKR